MRGRTLVYAGIGCVLSMMLACTPDSGASADKTLPPITGKAKLDWDSATMALPLDSYAMSGEDTRLVRAASRVAMARCITGQQAIPPGVAAAIRRDLAAPLQPNRWLIGRWNAKFVATDSPVMTQYSIVEGLDAPTEKVGQCVNDPAYLATGVIDLSEIGPDEQFNRLPEIGLESFHRAISDRRFKELVAKRTQCLRAKGYQIEEETLGGVKVDPMAGPEERTKAFVAEATCSDELDFAQRAGDLVATYQELAIAQYQGELVEIKKIVDERVAAARTLLSENGF